MNPLVVLLVLGVGWAFLRGKSADSGASSEAPKDANAMLATVLAPNMTNLDQLLQFFNYFTAAIANQTTPRATLRLSLYALATRLKVAMLQKGAQPNADELLAIAYAPASGMGGIQQLPGVPADMQQAAYAALVDSQQDVGTIGKYIEAMVTASSQGGKFDVATAKRLLAYLLAMKAKQMMLQANITFQSPAYFAVANMQNVPTTTPNSILGYK
jgi:hypothetical protein